jgi:hypothetical protein
LSSFLPLNSLNWANTVYHWHPHKQSWQAVDKYLPSKTSALSSARLSLNCAVHLCFLPAVAFALLSLLHFYRCRLRCIAVALSVATVIAVALFYLLLSQYLQSLLAFSSAILLLPSSAFQLSVFQPSIALSSLSSLLLLLFLYFIAAVSTLSWRFLFVVGIPFRFGAVASLFIKTAEVNDNGNNNDGLSWLCWIGLLLE